MTRVSDQDKRVILPKIPCLEVRNNKQSEESGVTWRISFLIQSHQMLEKSTPRASYLKIHSFSSLNFVVERVGSAFNFH